SWPNIWRMRKCRVWSHKKTLATELLATELLGALYSLLWYKGKPKARGLSARDLISTALGEAVVRRSRILRVNTASRGFSEGELPSYREPLMSQVRRLKFDEVGSWSEIKLDIVREYAAA